MCHQLSKIISWVAVLVWMTIIFYLSHQPVTISNGLSVGLTEVIVQKVEGIASDYEFNMDSANHIMRKNAHFFMYFVLGLFVISALWKSGVARYRGFRLALLICGLYAISDEVHQYFIEGRGPQLNDVLIDSAGAFVGISLFCFTKLMLSRRRFH
ncbi:hypothetical protein AEA09_13035 [Lysinibacillus contaminans]|uniref:VanZ-like domain-containing protein n=1 Tax=Lysinibacillus contaminans TaxID=1293441 RepID=A0ABR5K3B3_9BACI|nr:hypothetical protein AEA09_13035 [Lysinibacillus contaminans]